MDEITVLIKLHEKLLRKAQKVKELIDELSDEEAITVATPAQQQSVVADRTVSMASQSTQESRDQSVQSVLSTRESERTRMVEAAKNVLRKYGAPMTTYEIFRALSRQGFDFSMHSRPKVSLGMHLKFAADRDQLKALGGRTYALLDNDLFEEES